MYKIYKLLTVFLLISIVPGILSAQNIVSNSGFETGVAGELPEEWRDQKEGGAEGSVTLTDKEAHNGKYSLFIEHTNSDGYIHPNKSVAIQPGDYSFSFWAKSDSDIQFPAQIYCETDWNTLFDVSCNLKKDTWTQFSFPLSFAEECPGSIQIGLTEPGRLWLDDVELIKKKDFKKIANIQIWDTMTRIQDFQKIDKTGWKPVPANTTSIQGDIVLENEYLTTAFCSKKIAVYSKSGKKRFEIFLQSNDKPASFTSCRILQNTDDKVNIEARFSTKDTDFSASFSFTRKQIIEVKPAENVKSLCISSPIEFAVIPNFISDDLIFDPKDYLSREMLYIPSETLFLGLLNGNDSMLFITLPEGKQLRLALNSKQKQVRLFESIEIENDGKSVYLALLDAPSIWHKEQLKPSYLERDVAVDWKRTFPAKWITQLYEDGVKTTYTFKGTEPGEEGFWRAAIGWYKYPVWFNDEKAYFHLSKKIPPKGESIIYFLEREGTPLSVLTPVDVIKETLDRQACESILDPAGRRNRSLTRPDCTIDTATCAVTDALKRVFEAGEEVEKKEYVKGGTEDMIYFLGRERERALEYQSFAHEMIEFLTLMKKNKPGQKAFLDRMENITRELIAAYDYEKENIKDLDYARKLGEETQKLAQRKNPGNLEAFMKLKEEWTGMGGSVDDLNRILHTITRKLFQEAGYTCIDQPETVKIAEEIRTRTVKCLRNPGGYEIWSNY